MITPDKICLIYVGDIDNEICWCDSVPSSDIDEAEDVVYYIKQSEYDKLNTEIEKLRANAMPGGPGCCDICDTGGCCKAESEEE